MKYVKKEAACWEWTGSLMGGYKTDKYGQFSSMGKPTYAHRWSYTYFNGEIPKGKQIHHKCHNTKCVNPSHLEAVTQIENGLKHGKTNPPYLNSIKTHCKHGHPFSGDNLQIYTSQRNRPAYVLDGDIYYTPFFDYEGDDTLKYKIANYDGLDRKSVV